MPREILVDWSLPSGTASRSVMMFQTSAPVASQRVKLKAFLDTIKSQLDNAVTWTIETSGRELDDTTGALTGVWSESTPSTGVGVVNGEPVADSTMALMQWRTDHIVGGRFLQGRTFIPGLSTSNLSNGNLAAATVSAWTTAGNTLATSGVGFGIWHRPTSGSGGIFWAVDTASAWSELAVLRRRRA